jgi:hypothetical protein
MKQTIEKIMNHDIVLLLSVILFLMPCAVHATLYVVEFGDSLPFLGPSADISAVIGDTVQWNGDFTRCPFGSTVVPDGAATWYVTSGHSFSYVITVAGIFYYHYDINSGTGITGSFSAIADSALPVIGAVKNEPASAVIFSSAGQTFLRLNLHADEFVSGSLFTIDGRAMATLINTRLGSGNYTIPVQKIGPGVYIVRILTGEKKVVENLLVVR